MAITRLGGANAISGVIPTSVGGTGSTAATLPASLINDTSISNITALPAAVVTGKVVQAAYAVNTTEITSSSGVDITSLSFTPTNSSNKIIFFGNCGQIRKATAGTGSAASMNIRVNGEETNARSGNEGYPESESDTRGNMSCIGYGDAWSGAKTVSLAAAGFGTGISYSYQSSPSTLIVLEVEA